MSKEQPIAIVEANNLTISINLDILKYAVANYPEVTLKISDEKMFYKELLNTLNNPLNSNQVELGLNAMKGFIDEVIYKMVEDGCLSIIIDERND